MRLSISLHILISGHLQHLAQSAIKPDHGMNQRHRHGVSLMRNYPLSWSNMISPLIGYRSKTSANKCVGQDPTDIP
jgi:hypothetical protein